MADEIVLSFHDSLLRKSDVQLLDEGQWLNDKIIGFMFEYFEHLQFQNIENILFVNPDVAHFIKLCGDAELTTILDPLNVYEKKKIFIPVNDNMKPNATGGSHWSLLVYDSQEMNFKHYDSASMNRYSARHLTIALEPFLQVTKKMDEVICPQQINMHDCGMYVICFTEELCRQLQNEEERSVSCSHVNPGMVKQKRKEIINIIENLRKK